MKTWIVTYYKTRNFLTYKKIIAKSAAEAIKKSKVKYIIDLKTEEELKNK